MDSSMSFITVPVIVVILLKDYQAPEHQFRGGSNNVVK